MPIVDTSFLVAMLNKGDAHHAAAVSQAAGAAHLRVPAPVLAELLQFVYFMERRAYGERKAASAARAAARQLLSIPSLEVVESFGHPDALALYLGHETLTYVDCAGVTLARRAGEPLLTFDEDQKQVAAT